MENGNCCDGNRGKAIKKEKQGKAIITVWMSNSALPDIIDLMQSQLPVPVPQTPVTGYAKAKPGLWLFFYELLLEQG